MEQILKRQSRGMILGLAVQFLLGMVINLYTEFPESGDVRHYWEFANHNWLVMIHMIFGTLLVIGAISFLVRSVRSKLAQWKLPATLGLLSLILAWGAGDAFIGTQNDAFSYLMALGFILGIVCYSWGASRSQE